MVRDLVVQAEHGDRDAFAALVGMMSRRARGRTDRDHARNGGPVGADTNSQGVMGSERERMIVLDVGGQVVAIVIDATDSFETFVNRAMPIVQSFQFK